MNSTPGKSPGKDATPKGTLVIGIDFGTTFSGVAFTWSDKVDQVGVVNSWEADGDNVDEAKAPSAITYGPRGTFTWGYSVEPGDEQLKWFKLLLLKEDDIPEAIRASDKLQEARNYLEKHNKTPIQVVTEFLRHLWEYSLKCITKAIGKATVNYAQFHVAITLPAIWPSYAREGMRLAARDAGILDKRLGVETQLTFVPEPEAAAIAALADMEGRFDVKVKKIPKQGNLLMLATDCASG